MFSNLFYEVAQIDKPWNTLCRFSGEMKYSDALIIYLAIGSPLAVYCFLKSGREYSVRDLPRTILVLLLWPVYTILLVRHSSTSGRSRKVYSPDYGRLDARFAERVDEIRLSMEEIVHEKLQEQSVFDFREIFERYLGLTAAITSDAADLPSPFSELRLDKEENEKLNAICLNRRNRRLLEFHQIRARNDFLTFVSNVPKSTGSEPAFDILAFELSSIVQDAEAIEALKTYQAVLGQSENDSTVIDLENEVWLSKTPRQSATSRI
jgi:hypothetical protein